MLAKEDIIDIKFLKNIFGIDKTKLQEIQISLSPPFKIKKLNLKEMEIKTLALEDAKTDALSFITSSTDGKWLFAGGGDSLLLVIDRHSNSLHQKVSLKSLASCCYKKSNMLFIGGLDFI